MGRALERRKKTPIAMDALSTGQAALSKRPWTEEEDAALTAAVNKYGASRWSMIATQVATGRIGKQCRERWNNHLCPEVKKCEWSEEEDRAIMQGVALLGTRWCEIIKAPELCGRTDNSIKNRWFALDRKRKAKMAGGTNRMGPRKATEPSSTETMPPRSDANIVAIATELAFTTDEYDRDCLIEKLTAALRVKEKEDQAKALAERATATPGAAIISNVLSAEELIDAPDDLFERLDLELQPELRPAEFNSIAISEIAISLSESLCLPMAKPAVRRVVSSEGGASDRASDDEDTSEATSVHDHESVRGSRSCGGSLGSNLHDDESMPDLIGSSSAGSSPRSSPMHSPTTSPRTAAVMASPRCDPKPTDGATDGATPAFGRKLSVMAVPTSPLTGASPRRAALADVSAACLGGRHAYKAFLAPLSLPVVEIGELDSPKRLRTTPGGGYARVFTPQGSLDSATRRSDRAPSRLGGSPLSTSAGEAAAAAAAVAAAAAAVAAASPLGSGGFRGWHVKTGTKEPSMARHAAAPFSESISEELSEVFSEERITLDDFLNLLGEELMLPVEEDSFAPRSCAMQMRTAGGECGTEEPASAANQRRGKRCLA